MREILFRGKRTDGTGWIEGFYFQKPNPTSEDGRPVYHGITDLPPFCAEVIPETVGQYTGLKDQNGKRIFEGDIVHGDNYWHKNLRTYQVAFEDGCFFLVDSSGRLWHKDHIENCEVIGNIHDNPEMLEVEG